MTTQKLTIEAKEQEPATAIYELGGDLYGDTEGYAFQEMVRTKIASGTRRLIVDLSSVHRIDSCGIGILAAISISAQKASAGLVLASLPERIEKILGVTWFLEYIDHAESIPEALTKLDQMEIKIS